MKKAQLIAATITVVFTAILILSLSNVETVDLVQVNKVDSIQVSLLAAKDAEKKHQIAKQNNDSILAWVYAKMASDAYLKAGNKTKADEWKSKLE